MWRFPQRMKHCLSLGRPTNQYQKRHPSPLLKFLLNRNGILLMWWNNRRLPRGNWTQTRIYHHHVWKPFQLSVRNWGASLWNFATLMPWPVQFFVMRFQTWKIFFDKKNHWSLRLVLLTIQFGVGQMRLMVTRWLGKSGPTWSFCITPKNRTALLCWKLVWSKKFRASHTAQRKHFVLIIFGHLSTVTIFFWTPPTWITPIILLDIKHVASQGRPGCKNIRAGGDTVHESMATEQPLLYICCVQKFSNSSSSSCENQIHSQVTRICFTVTPLEILVKKWWWDRTRNVQIVMLASYIICIISSLLV